MRWFSLLSFTGLLFLGSVTSASRAQWNYSRFGGPSPANPALNGFNLGSPGPSYYPTNNYTAGSYLPSYNYGSYYGSGQIPSSYPTNSYGGYTAPAVGLLSLPNTTYGGFLTSSGRSSLLAPHTPSSLLSYPYGGVSGAFRDTSSSSSGYPFANSSMGVYSAGAGTYLGSRFAYP
jgi:hypothetical protein